MGHRRAHPDAVCGRGVGRAHRSAFRLPLSVRRALRRGVPHVLRTGSQGVRVARRRAAGGVGDRPAVAASPRQPRRRRRPRRPRRVPGDGDHPMTSGVGVAAKDRDVLTGQSSTHPSRTAPVEMSAAAFRTAGHALIDQIGDWLETLAEGPVLRDESPADVRRALHADRGLPDAGTEAGALLDEAATLLFRHSLFNGHPRFFGYITSSPAPIGALGDLLASAVNANVGAWQLAPMATEIERQTVRWIAELIGFGAGAGGLLVSGGNMANFICFLAARTAKAADVRTTGLRSLAAPLRVYASTETHTWIQKAADLFGLGTDAIRWIPTDEEQRMNVAALDAQIAADKAAGDQPFIVVGTAGTVSTGSVD